MMGLGGVLAVMDKRYRRVRERLRQRAGSQDATVAAQ